MNMMCVRGCVLLLFLMLQAVSPALSVVFTARNADDAGARLLPRPRRVEWHSFSLALDRVKLSTNVLLNDWEALIVELGGKVSEHAASVVSVVLLPVLEEVPLNQKEAYRLRVDERGIHVEAVTETAVYRAIQTLRQLAQATKKGVRIPCCEIVDWPAFRIRGWMHDTGRSYISMEELKREIAVLSKFKINTFHW
uniref:glycoside hydrolase family 20 zincin-like fold domain-containing protein n=1 Tax=Prevotella heparinolytica TaxID=28113 RepID=UPI00359F1D0B